MGAGFDDGRGHVIAYATYRKLKRSPRAGATIRPAPPGAHAGPGRTTRRAACRRPLFFCGGSATSANGTFSSPTARRPPSRSARTGPSSRASTPYNFAPTNYFQRPDERYTFGAFANYEISPALQPYLEVMFMDDRTVAQIAPSGDFGNTLDINCGAPGAPTVNAPGVGNPLLSAQQRAHPLRRRESGRPRIADHPDHAPADAAPCAPPTVFIDPTTGLPYTRGFAQILRRNVEGGGRRTISQHTNYRIVAGMRGDLRTPGPTTSTISSRRPISR